MIIVYKGESYNGSITVSKTVHGGSNPSSPVLRSLGNFEFVRALRRSDSKKN